MRTSAGSRQRNLMMAALLLLLVLVLSLGLFAVRGLSQPPRSVVGLAIAVAIVTVALIWLSWRFIELPYEAELAYGELAADLLREVAEREQEASEQLRVADQLKDAFLAAAGHDLANPVTAVLGFTHVLLRAGDRIPPEQSRQILEQIERAAARLSRLLSSLLDVQRLTRGVITAEREETDLVALANRIVSEQDARGHPLSVSGSALTADVDPMQVERIVENLVRNAIKYTPDGTPVEVWFERSDGGVLVTVDDEGPGVADALKESIFGAFHRGEVGAQSGMGIGLYLVAQFAHLHEGRAWIEDRPGGGARFRVLLAVPQETAQTMT